MKKIITLILALVALATGAKAQDMTSTPLTFQALEAGTVAVNWEQWSSPTLDAIQYRLNDGEWTEATWNTPINVAANDVVSFRGNNGTCYDESTWAGFRLECSNQCYVYGNIMSLIDQDGFATNTALTKSYAFFHLFERSDFEANNTILNHPTKDIVLPATTLTINCYDGLFSNCQGITRAPELPATQLQEWCYSAMFMNCSSLAVAPQLSATTLANACYSDMFMGCTSLTEAPELPAASLVEGCYSSMFSGCSNLNYVKCLATDISADYCTANWLGGVAANGTFVKAAGMESWTVGQDANDNVNGIPAGWTVEDYSAQPAKTAYAVFTDDNRYLYFTYREEDLEVGDQFTPEGSSSSKNITKIFKGDEVTNYTGTPGWTSDYFQARQIYVVNIESSFRDVKPKNGCAWFQSMSQLVYLNGLSNLDTSEMTDMGFMFSGCKVSKIGEISAFNTSKVTNMHLMFQNNKVTSLNLSGWDVSNVTNMSNMFRGCANLKTLDVEGWNTANVENMALMFYGCKALQRLNLSSWNTSKITSMADMFYNCNNLEEISFGSGWNTSNVTSFERMFYGCEDLGNNLDVSTWDTGNVETMYEMFYGCTGLYGLDVSKWNTSKVTDMSFMFYDCRYLYSPLDVSGWDTSNVTDMRFMFYNCFSLSALDVSQWDTSNAENLNNMFNGCKGVPTLDVSQWDTHKVSSMEEMFTNCSGVSTLDLSHWDFTQVDGVASMFSGCSNLTALDLSRLNTCGIKDMKSMFKGCAKLTTLNLKNLYTGNVTDMSSLFNGCSSLKDVYVSNLWKTNNVTADANMFTGCTVIEGQDGTTYNDAVVNKDVAHYSAGGYLKNGGDVNFGAQPYAIFNDEQKTVYLTYTDQNLMGETSFTPEGSSSPIDISNLWYGDVVITSSLYSTYYTSAFSTPWAAWDGDTRKVVFEPSFSQVRPTTTAYWFSRMNYLTTIEGMEYLNTSDVTSMRGMFYSCQNLTGADVSHFDTQNVTDMSWMFCYDSELKSLDMSGWNTENLIHTNVMFSDSGVKSLDLSSWSTPNLLSSNQMFTSYNLEAVYVGEGWNVDGVISSDGMFSYSDNIIGEDGTTYSEAAAYDKSVAHCGAGGLMRRHHDSYTITIPSSGYATFSAAEKVNLPEGLKAYTCTTFDAEAGAISTQAIAGVVPANTGVLLRGTAGEQYTLYATADEADASADDDLVAVTVPTHIDATDGDYTNFMLKSGKFIKIAEAEASSKMPANKAYLQVLSAALNSDTAANGISVVWDESVTGIHEATLPSDASSAIYDLQGRRVTKPGKGIYIVNGKKTIFK